METYSLTLPAMYGDHHVTEVRQIIFSLPGVADVYASSSFQLVEVTYDPEKVTPGQIESRLAEAGYTGPLPTPAEPGAAFTRDSDHGGFFRQTEVFEENRQVVGFAQTVKTPGRALWPCPGMGPIPTTPPEE